MKINSPCAVPADYVHANKNQNQSFGRLIVNQATLERASIQERILLSEISKEKLNLRKILNYDSVSATVKGKLDAIFAKMPKEEVEDYTLYGEISNKKERHNRLLNVKLTSEYPESALIYSFNDVRHYKPIPARNDFDYDNAVAISDSNDEYVRSNGLNFENKDALPIPTIQLIKQSIADSFNRKFINEQKTSLIIDCRDEILRASIKGTCYERYYDNFVGAINMAKPDLEKLAEKYNIDLRYSAPYGIYNSLRIAVRTLDDRGEYIEFVNMGNYDINGPKGSKEKGAAYIVSTVKKLINSVENNYKNHCAPTVYG